MSIPSRSRTTARLAAQARWALLNVKFALALKDEELAKLRAEQRSHELDASRQALIRDAIAAAAVATIVAIAALLSAWLWHRRKIAVDARAAAEERLAAVGRLTGGVAHDFNNLLSVIHQAAGLLALRESVKADAIAEQLVEQARRAARLCADITSQLLSFARQQNLSPEPVDLDRCLREALPLLERAAGTSVKVVLETHVPMPQAWVDRRQLTAALLNLVSNARDALPDGGTVTVRVTPDRDRMVRIDVVDDGHGMRPEALARATEPFYSTKAVGDGSGLGLSMVHGFATQSGGNALHRQCAERRHNGVDAATRGGHRDMSGTAHPEPIHVLVVEDHRMVREMLEQTLVTMGCRVTVAETGDQAILLLQGGLWPDVLLSDIRMPGALNGLDLARWARQQLPSVAVLLQTGFAESDTGDFVVLRKPFEPDELMHALREAIASRALGPGGGGRGLRRV